MFTNNKDDYKWIRESVEGMCDGVDAKIGWHFCFGNAWGNDILSANFPEGYQTVLPYFWGTEGVDEFVLDYANRHMEGVEFLKNCPKDKGVQVGVLDIRTSMVETPNMIADRVRKVIKGGLSPEQITLSTDCGMKPLARMVAKLKLQRARRGRRDRPQGSRRPLILAFAIGCASSVANGRRPGKPVRLFFRAGGQRTKRAA